MALYNDSFPEGRIIFEKCPITGFSISYDDSMFTDKGFDGYEYKLESGILIMIDGSVFRSRERHFPKLHRNREKLIKILSNCQDKEFLIDRQLVDALN